MFGKGHHLVHRNGLSGRVRLSKALPEPFSRCLIGSDPNVNDAPIGESRSGLRSFWGMTRGCGWSPFARGGSLFSLVVVVGGVDARRGLSAGRFGLENGREPEARS